MKKSEIATFVFNFVACLTFVILGIVKLGFVGAIIGYFVGVVFTVLTLGVIALVGIFKWRKSTDVNIDIIGNAIKAKIKGKNAMTADELDSWL